MIFENKIVNHYILYKDEYIFKWKYYWKKLLLWSKTKLNSLYNFVFQGFPSHDSALSFWYYYWF